MQELSHPLIDNDYYQIKSIQMGSTTMTLGGMWIPSIENMI